MQPAVTAAAVPINQSFVIASQASDITAPTKPQHIKSLAASENETSAYHIRHRPAPSPAAVSVLRADSLQQLLHPHHRLMLSSVPVGQRRLRAVR